MRELANEESRQSYLAGRLPTLATGRGVAGNYAVGTEFVKASPADHLNHDSTDLLSNRNVTPEMARPASGQDLIERKLSVSEGA
ncbi:MAG TPA: hypothetical protein VFW71_15360 [Actinomycetota bacterium]|nr:hypothetical protein [Actinomycetota bacterium]